MGPASCRAYLVGRKRPSDRIYVTASPLLADLTSLWVLSSGRHALSVGTRLLGPAIGSLQIDAFEPLRERKRRVPMSILLLKDGFGGGAGRRVCKYLHRVSFGDSQKDDHFPNNSLTIANRDAVASRVR